MNTGFNKRGFVSMLAALSFLTLPVTGLLMHKAREGADVFGNHLWMGAHNIFAVLFLVTAVFHIQYNWAVLLVYMKKGEQKLTWLSRETGAALGVFVVVILLTVSHAYWG